MAALPIKNGRNWTVRWMAKKASTAIGLNAFLIMDTGQVTIATSGSASIAGVSLRAVASGDSDYATTYRIPVLVPDDTLVFRVDVGTGSATAALVGTYVDLKDSDEADVDASTTDILLVTDVPSTTVIHAIIYKRDNG